MKTGCVLFMFVVSLPAWAQSQRPIIVQDEFTSNRPSNAPTSVNGQEYRIGVNDLIEISVFEVPDLTTISRVTASGTLSMNYVGSVSVLGRTTEELARSVEEALKKSINDPRVNVFVREYASQPVTIMGAVKLPGIYQIKGQKFLLEMMAMAQGLDISHGNTIQVMRRKSDGTATTISVSIEDLIQNGKSELNIPIEAGDTINVLQAGSVFIIGEVARGGEVTLRYGRDITVAQAIAQSGGFTKEAQRKESKIVRIHRDGTRDEIPVNIEKILEGADDDVRLMPNDILFVPASRIKAGLMKALDSTIGVVSGRLIYRF